MEQITNEVKNDISEVAKMILSLNPMNRTLILSGAQLLVASQEANSKAS